MRVIAGEHKGRRLKAVPGQKTRPTTDKVKESMFNIIGPYFDGGLALDLFAGTGGLGIESLSRGIDKAVFIDQDYKAVSVIRENIRDLRLDAQAEIFKNDAKRALDQLAERGLQFDLVFLALPEDLAVRRADPQAAGTASFDRNGRDRRGARGRRRIAGPLCCGCAQAACDLWRDRHQLLPAGERR